MFISSLWCRGKLWCSVKLKMKPSVKTLRPLTFHRILEALCVEWRNSKPRFASILERRTENIKYLISSSGNRIHNLSCWQSHACAPSPWVASHSPATVRLIFLYSLYFYSLIASKNLSTRPSLLRLELGLRT